MAWLLWVRLNRQTDFLTGRVSYERPLFHMARGFFVWIEGGGETAALRRHYEMIVARQADKIQHLQNEMHRVDQFQNDIETHFGDHPLL
jgi:hypothetical protein